MSAQSQMMTGFSSRWGAALLGLATAGCFYTDPINEHPSASILKREDGPHYVGVSVTFDASKSADDGDRGALRANWRVFACDTLEAGGSCDEVIEQRRSGLSIFDEFVVTPIDLRTHQVELTVIDGYGAPSRAVDIFPLEIANGDPTLSLQLQGYRHEDDNSFVISRPIQVVATASDAEDGEDIGLEWELFPPPASDAEVRSWVELDDRRYQLTPDAEGLWRVVVTATDSAGGEAQISEQILVAPDRPPCLELTDPEAIAGAYYLVRRSDGPRRFSVLTVSDDLDPFPAVGDDDPVTGTTAFRWYLAAPGEDVPSLVAGHDAADFVIDPDEHGPGDRLLLRVEIDDREGRDLTCAASAPTCAVDSGSECLQRLTWGVEVR